MTCCFLPGPLEELAEEGPLDDNQIAWLFGRYTCSSFARVQAEAHGAKD